MSHELRTPLNAIIGYSDLLQVLAARKQDTTYTDDLQRIQKAGKHLLTLINDILDISKIEAGKLELEMQVFDVSMILEEINETVQPLASQNSNTFTVNVASDLSPVNADYTRLKQCLLNLLSNACKFTQAGEVDFSITQEQVRGQEFVTFRVADTGVGLSEDQAARLFQPFSQADASTTRKFGGTGLGLSITKTLCEAMGGSISLQSQLGTGSTFTIRLPAATSRMLCATI
jgi:signal transduction histidine kinase